MAFVRFLRLHVPALLAIGAAFVLVPATSVGALESFTTSRLVISSGEGEHAFTVELATTPEQRAQGLMWRRRLEPDRGMLFLYDRDHVIRMWMKNTLIPLDMLFIDRDGIVVRIHERAIPRSVRAITSGTRARAVLELAGGTVARLGLGVGDRVRHPAFGEP